MDPIYFTFLLIVFGADNVQTWQQNNRVMNITIEAFDSINIGMSEADAVRTLGGPPGFYFNGNVFFRTTAVVEPAMHYWGNKENKSGFPIIFPCQSSKGQSSPYISKGWIGNNIGIWITFERGKVVSIAKHIVTTCE